MREPGLIRTLRAHLDHTFGLSDRREPGLRNHISLGNHCHMARILKTLGLRTWSAPFDWIFSSPSMIADCLADDFSALLDRSQYRSTPMAERPAPDQSSCRHLLYYERHGILYVFNHHDPATREEDYRFLSEGVRRLRVAFGRPDAENRFYALLTRPTPEASVLDLARRLAERGSGNRLAVIQTDAGISGTETVITSCPNLTWTRVGVQSPSLGVVFADPADESLVRGLVLELAERP